MKTDKSSDSNSKDHQTKRSQIWKIVKFLIATVLSIVGIILTIVGIQVSNRSNDLISRVTDLQKQIRSEVSALQGQVEFEVDALKSHIDDGFDVAYLEFVSISNQLNITRNLISENVSNSFVSQDQSINQQNIELALANLEYLYNELIKSSDEPEIRTVKNALSYNSGFVDHDGGKSPVTRSGVETYSAPLGWSIIEVIPNEGAKLGATVTHSIDEVVVNVEGDENLLSAYISFNEKYLATVINLDYDIGATIQDIIDRLERATIIDSERSTLTVDWSAETVCLDYFLRCLNHHNAHASGNYDVILERNDNIDVEKTELYLELLNNLSELILSL